jgi:protein-tyrosine phosphatase
MPVYYDPVLELRSIVNFRDIGGHRTRSGRSVRRGCVYRSGHLAQASEGDLERLRGAGIRCVIDFRTTGDMAGDGGARLPGGARRVHLPMGDPSRAATEIRTLLFDGDRVTMEAQLGDGGAEQMMLDAARALVLERTREYGEMVRTLAAEDALPAIVHCSAGKDRTGWAASLLLLMLDVPEEAIVAHYAESDVQSGITPAPGWPAMMPPSATNSAPVEYELSSEARKSTSLAISSGRPMREIGRLA